MIMSLTDTNVNELYQINDEEIEALNANELDALENFVNTIIIIPGDERVARVETNVTFWYFLVSQIEQYPIGTLIGNEDGIDNEWMTKLKWNNPFQPNVED